MPGTSSSYVAFTLRLPSFVHIFISKAIKKRSLLIALLRIDLDPVAGTEASLFNCAERARPGPATGRVEPLSGAKGGDPLLGPNDFFTTFSKKDSALVSLSLSCFDRKNREIQKSKRTYQSQGRSSRETAYAPGLWHLHSPLLA
jgi:hypothetical protein